MSATSLLVVILIIGSLASNDLANTSKLDSFLQIRGEETISEQISEVNKCNKNPEGVFEFPKDEKYHPMIEEWWYWALQLFTEDGTHYSAQWAFVKNHVQATPTMELSFIFYSPEKVKYNTRTITQEIEEVDGEFSLNYGDAQAYGKNETYEVYGEVDDIVLSVNVTPVKAPFLYYEDGHQDMYYGGYMDYYCRPRNEVTGTLKIGDQEHQITGYGYYERAMGRLRSIYHDGWDWFQIALDDGTEIMVVLIRFNYYVWTYDQNCNTAQHDFKLEITNTWLSPKTQCQYASGWILTFDDKEYIIEAIHQDNEIIEKVAIKYEGPLVISGSGTGRGYIETVGIC